MLLEILGIKGAQRLESLLGPKIEALYTSSSLRSNNSVIAIMEITSRVILVILL